jgi:hypothetical protein
MASRSNQPRVPGKLKMNKWDYDMATEVAGQKPTTPKEAKTQKQAINEAKAFESMFPKLAQSRRGSAPSVTSQARTQGGVKTTTSTVNKLYRPMGN